MITLTSDYQYLGRSSGMTAKSGYATYYLLLYGKTISNKDTGVHKVYVKFYIASDKNSTFYWYSTEYNGKINNTQVFGSSTDKEPRDAWELSSFKAGDVTYNKATLIKEGSLDIDCSDGLSKNIPLSAYWKIVNDDGDTYVPASGTNRTVSATVTLPAIPRATTLDSFSGNKRIGVSDDVIINFTKKNASFTTTLEYATTANFSDAVTIVDKSANANTYSWTIPISLLNKIPNSKTLPIYIRLTTYNGDSQIGIAQTSSFTANVYADNCRPIWETHSIEETDTTAKQLVTTTNKFIANLSKPKFTFEAEGQYGATISYYQINNTTRSSGFIDSSFNTNGYTLKAVDSRGIENTYTFDLTYVPYFTPVFEEVKLFRDVPTGNKMFSFFRIKFFNNTSDIKFDNPQALSYKFNYQESGGAEQEKTIIPETYDDGTSRYAENETELGNTFNYKKNVDWTFSFIDLTGKVFTTSNTLPMGIPLMNGKMNSEGEQELFVNGKTTFNENVNFKGITNTQYSNSNDFRALPSGTDTINYWSNLPNGTYWYSNTNAVPNMPSSWGFVEKTGLIGGDFTVMFYTQSSGSIYRKSGNANSMTGWIEQMNKSRLLDLIYPVGSIYMSVNNVSPQTFLGGTWTALKDSFLIGAGNTYAVNATGGSTTHTLTVDEIPNHTHVQNTIGSDGNINPWVSAATGGGWGGVVTKQQSAYYGDWKRVPVKTTGTGGGKGHNNMPPYLAVYMWKRTA